MAMSGTPPMRGREAEFARICDLLSAARGGEGSVLVVEGGAGFGKTRLLLAAAEQAAVSGLRTGLGAARDGGQVVPMMSLMSPLFAGDEPLLDRGKLKDLPSAPGQQFWLLEELAGLLETAAAEEPLLVCLDDLQWADRGTLAALRYLPEQLASLPIVWVVALRREGASGEALNVVDFLRSRGAHQIDLGPLDVGAIRQVVEDILGSPADQELWGLVASTDGHPCLLVELLRGLMDEGRLRLDGDGAHLSCGHLPLRLQDLMRVHLGHLSEQARRLAGVGAVLGRRFSHDQLAAMLDRPAAAVLGPVEELLAAGLVVEEGERLAFRHDLLREVILQTLPASSRQALRRRALDVFLAEGAPPVEIAHQLADSAEPGDHVAISLLSRAAESLQMLDSTAAADLAVKTLQLAAPDDTMRGSLVAQAALLLYAAGRCDEGEALARDALRGALPTEQYAEVCLSIATMFSIPADVRERACRQALQLANLPERFVPPLRAGLANSLTHLGGLEESRRLLDGIDGEIAPTAHPDVRFLFRHASWELALMEDRFGDTLEAARDFRVSGEAGKPMDAYLADVVAMECLTLRDDFGEAFRLAETSLAAAQQADQLFLANTLDWSRARYWAAAGRLEDAAAVLEGASPTIRCHQIGNTGYAAVLLALGKVALHTGDQRQLEACARSATLAMDRLPAEPYQHVAWLLALQQMAAGDPVAARTVLTRHHCPSMPALPRLLADPADPPQLVRIALACGDDELAAEAVSIAEHRQQRNPDVGSLEAVAAHARGLRDGDCAELTRAVQLFASSPRRLAAASAVEDLGRLLIRSGRAADGINQLGEALRLYARMGAIWDANRVRGRLRRRGVRRNLQAARSAQGWAGLTESELAVARLAAEGQTNRQVAGQLFLSPNTVGSHLRSIFAKLGIRSRVELARLYVSRRTACDAGASAVPADSEAFHVSR
jgi:DNA-binding CsgD family transcriptional regulator